MLKKLACLVAILGMAGVATAAVDWIGNNDGVGDNTSFNDGLNWDDHVNPTNSAWNILRRNYYPYTPVQNWDIHVTGNITTLSGWVYNGVTTGAGACTISMTVDSGVTMTHSSGYLYWYNPGSLTVKQNATYDFRYGDFYLETPGGNFTTTIEEDALLYCSVLRHNNGSKVDVYGTLRANSVNRISADPGYRLNVYNGGLFQVDTLVPSGVWSKDGKVTVFVCGTVKLAGNHTAPSDYLAKVQAGETGPNIGWDVWYEGGYTYIHLVPEPATALFLLAGLPLLRRRRA